MLRYVIGLCFLLSSCTSVSATSVAAPDAGHQRQPHDPGDAGSPDDAKAHDPDAHQVPQPLIDLAQLQRVEGTVDDPMPEHRPEPVVCGEDGAYLEDSQLEINTRFCNYASFRASALRSVAIRQKVTIHITHFDLTSPEPAQAHLALFAGHERIWEKYVDIPRRADVIGATFEAQSAIPRGAPITFHLHNHGQNTWRLVRVDVLP